MGGPSPEGPVATSARIGQLDALRGFALLGILWANVRQMLMPFDAGSYAVALGGSERLAWLDWQLFHSLVDLKFITLFSVLFGIGFALQYERITARDDRFAGTYLRRVVILALFGVAHGLLLYSAEVLLLYAVGGLLLLTMRSWPTDRLLKGGLWLLGVTLVWGYQISALGGASLAITVTSAVVLAAVTFSAWQESWRVALIAWTIVLMASAITLTVYFGGAAPEDAVANDYREAQRQLAAIATGVGKAPREWLVRESGDFPALLSLHVEQYTQALFYFAIFLLWKTLALFMIGAGLFRSGLFARAGSSTWSRVARAGLAIGLPLSLLATWLEGREALGFMDWRWPAFLHVLSSLPLAAGMAGVVFVVQERPSHRWLWSRIESAGRMALTNYLGQSLVIATLAEPWGFGLYGHLSGVQMTATALIVYALLAETSFRWLNRYRMGPLEWLWRCGTYRRWLPIRVPASTRSAGSP